MNATLTRIIHPEIRVIDSARGIVDYIASDETLDSYREVIRANGWRFNHFAKNAPFVDSHDYYSIDKLLGKVIDFRVEGPQLIERVQWAIDVPDNKLAQLGWRMTEAGYLKAVSVGFRPTRMATKWDTDRSAWLEQLKELNLHEEDGPRCIYIEQEQLELSACIIGANPNALAKAHKAGVVTDADLETISDEIRKRELARSATNPADAERADRLAQKRFLGRLKLATTL